MATAGFGNHRSSYSTARAFPPRAGEATSEAGRVGLVRFVCLFPWSGKVLTRAPVK